MGRKGSFEERAEVAPTAGYDEEDALPIQTGDAWGIGPGLCGLPRKAASTKLGHPGCARGPPLPLLAPTEEAEDSQY
jgi:hypothetical protein